MVQDKNENDRSFDSSTSSSESSLDNDLLIEIDNQDLQKINDDVKNNDKNQEQSKIAQSMGSPATALDMRKSYSYT